MMNLKNRLAATAAVGELLLMVTSFIEVRGHIWLACLSSDREQLVMNVPVRRPTEVEFVVLGALLRNGYSWVDTGMLRRLVPVSPAAIRLEQMYDRGIVRADEVCA